MQMTFININFRLCLGLLPSPIVDLPGPSLFGTLCKKSRYSSTLLLLVDHGCVYKRKQDCCLSVGKARHCMDGTQYNAKAARESLSKKKNSTFHFQDYCSLWRERGNIFSCSPEYFLFSSLETGLYYLLSFSATTTTFLSIRLRTTTTTSLPFFGGAFSSRRTVNALLHWLSPSCGRGAQLRFAQDIVHEIGQGTKSQKKPALNYVGIHLASFVLSHSLSSPFKDFH
jgi:hypothetical protein